MFRPNRKLIVCAMSVAGIVIPASACGPFFPNQLLIHGDEVATWAPVAEFRHEIDRIRPPDRNAPAAIPPPRGKDVFDQTADVEADEIRAALNAAHVPVGQQNLVLREIMSFRTVLHGHQPGQTMKARTPLPVSAPSLAGLPVDFALYLRGMVAYANGDATAARATWQDLLSRPEAERRRRTVWATFMIGKSFLESDPAEAAKWFERVRVLARQGLPDPLGLAASSLGWQARIEFADGRYTKAIGLYLAQHATGDPTAATSLQDVAQSLFNKHPELLKVVATDAASASVLTAYLLANGGPFHQSAKPEAAERWLHAIETSGIASIVGADRLAWASYQMNDLFAADAWLQKAPADSAIACWVRAKLLLRKGKVDEAASSLARAAHAFPREEAWDEVPGTYEAEEYSHGLYPAERVEAELGVLQLSRGQFVDSLDLLLRAGWWEDAAYVAERVLTPEELMAYANRNCPDPGPSATAKRDLEAAVRLRALLARRLTRIGRWKDARPYFNADLQSTLDRYIAAIRAGHDERLPPSDRAGSLWTAAKIARERGMDLLATELAPDSADTRGSFPDSDIAPIRSKPGFGKLLGPTVEEIKRTDSLPAEPNKRWHYRYTAADHAWTAAGLMPDDTEELARLLCEAGSWLRNDDPLAADRFYKALVNRCPSTALGEEAARLHWFPKSFPLAH